MYSSEFYLLYPCYSQVWTLSKCSKTRHLSPNGHKSSFFVTPFVGHKLEYLLSKLLKPKRRLLHWIVPFNCKSSFRCWYDIYDWMTWIKGRKVKRMYKKREVRADCGLKPVGYMSSWGQYFVLYVFRTIMMDESIFSVSHRTSPTR